MSFDALDRARRAEVDKFRALRDRLIAASEALQHRSEIRVHLAQKKKDLAAKRSIEEEGQFENSKKLATVELKNKDVEAEDEAVAELLKEIKAVCDRKSSPLQ
ncbi:hypothetical protein L596_022036 [Steinernema carpocapsae]|uniref:Uncharacterized protein n=1 Tax=Steinernema carpocapsae TaxID=34508 RepID=A0A4U5MLD3_STECR|nr:hypothetical protein L596_022036 [Steinernema carpocapsae]